MILVFCCQSFLSVLQCSHSVLQVSILRLTAHFQAKTLFWGSIYSAVLSVSVLRACRRAPHVCTHVANTRASTWLHQRAKHNNNTATTIIGSLQLHKKNARKTTMICMQHKRTQAPSTTDNEKTREKREQIRKRKKREMSRWLVFFLLRGCELIIPYQDTHQIYTTPCFFWAREAGVRHKDVPNSPTGDRFDPCAHRWVKDHGFSGSRGSAPKICSSSRSSLGKVVRSEFLAFGRYTSPPPGGARGEGGNSGCVW